MAYKSGATKYLLTGMILQAGPKRNPLRWLDMADRPGFSNRKRKKRGCDRRRGNFLDLLMQRELCRWCFLPSEKY